ncbi:MAG: TfoX/Sxy family protein [Rhodobacteraceae bacterium]|jgi:hypothetical protein|nr:TfoX/Sxy family protein [Paracoccaceae bacterium]
MAYDEGLAQLLRDDLAEEPFREQKMFGGLCFTLRGHMVAGVHSIGTMYRIDARRRAAAAAVPGAQPLRMGAREMAGMIGLSPEDTADDARRGALLALALATVRTLPPKVAKAPKG